LWSSEIPNSTGTTAIASIEEVGMGAALDDDGRDDRRIESIAPRSLERRIAGTEVLALDHEDVPLHNALRPGIGGRRGRAQVAQHLLGDGG
jgi:hypothetical protein